MLSVQLFTLVLLLVAAAVTQNAIEYQKAMKDCAEELGFREDDIIDLDLEHGHDTSARCFRGCVMRKGGEIFGPDSLVAKNLASCNASVPKSEDQCIYDEAIMDCVKRTW